MLRCVSLFVRVTTVPHFRFMIRSGRFLPPSLAVWLCSAGLQIAPITLQRSCQEHQRSWTAFVINNRQRSCDNMTNACLHIAALLRCIPAGPGSGVRLCWWEVSLSTCTKILVKYLKFGHYPFAPYSPVLVQHDKLVEPYFRKRLTQVTVNEIKYFSIACSSRYSRLVSVSSESPSFKKSL